MSHQSINFRVGASVKMLVGSNVIDQGIVRRFESSEHPQFVQEIAVESLEAFPGRVTEFASPISSGDTTSWLMLFHDPFTGGRCYAERGPLYQFVAV